MNQLVGFDRIDISQFLFLAESGLVQQLFAEGPVEPFDVCILIGFAGLDVLDGDAGWI